MGYKPLTKWHIQVGNNLRDNGDSWIDDLNG